MMMTVRSLIGRGLIRICNWILLHSSDADLKAENMMVSIYRRKTGETNTKGRPE
jgi:hypothetical protein